MILDLDTLRLVMGPVLVLLGCTPHTTPPAPSAASSSDRPSLPPLDTPIAPPAELAPMRVLGDTRWRAVGVLASGGDRVATSGLRAVVLDANTGEALISVGPVARSVALSADGATLFTGGEDGLVRVYRVTDGALLYVLAWHLAPIVQLVSSTDGAWLGSADTSGEVEVWDSAARRLSRSIPPDEELSETRREVRALYVDGVSATIARSWAVEHHEGGVLRWSTEVATGQPVALQRQLDRVVIVQATDLERQSTGGQVVSVAYGLLDGAPTELSRFALGYEEVAAVSADLSRIAVGSAEGTVVRDASGRTLATLEDPRPAVPDVRDASLRHPEHVHFLPDGRTLTTPQYATHLAVHGPDGKLLHRTTGDGGIVDQIDVTPDGRRLAASGPRDLSVWDTTDAKVLAHFPDRSPTDLALSDDGLHLACLTSNDAPVRLFAVDSRREEPVALPDGGGYTIYETIAGTPDGFAIAGIEGLIRRFGVDGTVGAPLVLDPAAVTRWQDTQEPGLEILDLAVQSDGRLAYTVPTETRLLDPGGRPVRGVSGVVGEWAAVRAGGRGWLIGNDGRVAELDPDGKVLREAAGDVYPGVPPVVAGGVLWWADRQSLSLVGLDPDGRRLQVPVRNVSSLDAAEDVVWTGHHDGTIRGWPAAALIAAASVVVGTETPTELPVLAEAATAVVWPSGPVEGVPSPDGAWVATPTSLGRGVAPGVSVADVASGVVLARFATGGAVERLDWLDAGALIWRVGSVTEVMVLASGERHTPWPTTRDFSLLPGGLVVLAGEDTLIRRTSDGAAVARVPSPSREVAVRDGHVLTLDDAGVSRTWDSL